MKRRFFINLFVFCILLTVSFVAYNDNIYGNIVKWIPPSENESMEMHQNQNSRRRHLCAWLTTFKNATGRKVIQMNTLRNWATFLPRMQPVLFSHQPSVDYENFAEQIGWARFSIPAVNIHGTPYLNDMILKLINDTTIINSPFFYGFANGDILFDDTLPATLSSIAHHVSSLPSAPILITGRRTNFEFPVNRTVNEINDIFVIEKMRRFGSLFRSDAEDYFFFTRDFPWHNIKRLVIGRPGYDNYLVAMARRLNVTVIDATHTLTALHQMAPKEGNEAGSKNSDGNYNKDVIGNFNYYDGLTTTARYETVFDREEMMIRIRDRQVKDWVSLPQRS